MSVKNKTLQQKTAELNKLIEWFDGDEFEIEVALEKFKQAQQLAREIEKDLLLVKNEINVIKKTFDKELV